MNKIERLFEKWNERSNHEYIKAICKPCWELKYCPYGSLVEEFPIAEDSEYTCRIFGHICPVFKVAEPLTETIEQRNIGRNIPNQIKMKVNRRDNFVCQKCRKNVMDEEVNYDHIIPFSKGGPTDVSNIQILCEVCNKSKGNSYEGEFLVITPSELYGDPIKLDYDLFEDLLVLQEIYLFISNIFNEIEAVKEVFLQVIKTEDIETDFFMWSIIEEINKLLTKKKFTPIKKKLEIMRYRWGLKDKQIHNISEVRCKYHVNSEYCFEAERMLFRHLGFILTKDILQNNLYLEAKVESGLIKEKVKTIIVDLETGKLSEY
jgi:hypothetical protein